MIGRTIDIFYFDFSARLLQAVLSTGKLSHSYHAARDAPSDPTEETKIASQDRVAV
jgi:hypothetical protein